MLGSTKATVSTRQFNDLMDYIKRLSGLDTTDPSGPADQRKPRLEPIRRFLVDKVLGNEHRRNRDTEAGGR